MIVYRPFRNSDPPALASLWRSLPPLRGMAPFVSPQDLERLVFSKPWFDRHGLVVAVDDGRPCGFAHAGFGPAAARTRIDPARGVVCQVRVEPRDDAGEIAQQLLSAGEDYLRNRGAKTATAGGRPPDDPFYLGLYGGSELPGVLESDEAAVALFRRSGYRETGRVSIMQRKLAGFRPVVDRDQMKIRRGCDIHVEEDPPAADWWQACTLGSAAVSRFSACNRAGGATCGSLLAWDMEPLAQGWGVRAVGIVGLEVSAERRRQGLATFLLGESLRRAHAAGAMLAEAQAASDDGPACGLLSKLGFDETEQGVVLVKDLA